MFATNISQSKWLICLICLIPIIGLLALALAIVLGLIPVYLPRSGSDIQNSGRWIESKSIVYDLPNKLSSKLVVIRDESLPQTKADLLQKLFNNKLASDIRTKHINMEIKAAVVSKQVEDRTVKVNTIEQRSSSNETHIHLSKGQSGQPKDTIYQLLLDMNLLFSNNCLKTCRQPLVSYIIDQLFSSIDIDRESYISMFVNTSTDPSTTTTTITTSTGTNDMTTDTDINDISPTVISLLNADELQFNDPNQTLIIQFSSPILDIYNYLILLNNEPVFNTTNTKSNITILDYSRNETVLLNLLALDTSGVPIFKSFKLYYGSISMPVRVFYQNGSAASGVFVQANLTDSPNVGQSGYTDENGTIIFTNVPLRTISLFARTTNNQIALAGIAPSIFGVDLKLIPFGIDTSNSTKKLQILNVEKSKEGFLHLMTKRDLEMPGFTITTSGIGLRMVSKMYSVEKNSTSISIKYKFITAEVPGGYFGSKYNDYFSVTIRSNDGNYETISRSMNALGLGAFDYATGATDWFVLKLPLSGKSELIQVDVGVANVGDGALQSTVMVDKISIEKCDKCDDCTKCPTNPMCLTTCTNPPEKSCLFYMECMEGTINCGSNGYAIGYGTKYCQKFLGRMNWFTTDGQNWIYKTMNCLQKSLVTPLNNCKNNCQQLRTIAFDSHPKCYEESGVCDLPIIDYVSILLTVGQEFTTEEGRKQARITFGDCASVIITKLDNAITDAITDAIDKVKAVQLTITKKFFELLQVDK